MSIIPDARTDEYYNEKYLNEPDGYATLGYDIAAENVEMFIANISDLEDDIKDALGDIDLGEIDDSLIANGEVFLSSLTEEQEENISPITKLMLLMKEKLLLDLEMQRDEMITSLLDGYNKKTFDEIKRRTDAGEYKNPILRHREYIEKYDRGEIPTCSEYKKDPETGKTLRIGKCSNGNEIIEEIEEERENG